MKSNIKKTSRKSRKLNSSYKKRSSGKVNSNARSRKRTSRKSRKLNSSYKKRTSGKVNSNSRIRKRTSGKVNYRKKNSIKRPVFRFPTLIDSNLTPIDINLTLINTYFLDNIKNREQDIKTQIEGLSLKCQQKCQQKCTDKNLCVNSCSNSCSNSWLLCEDDCVQTLFELANLEIKSTYYILSALHNSLIPNTTKFEIELVQGSEEKITGIWDNDKEYIKIKNYGHETIKKDKGELIFGFGPSASGKTFWTSSLLTTLYPNNTFISIDGGIYREYSFVYQTIITHIKKVSIKGITNLIDTSLKAMISDKLGVYNIFDSNYAKNSICKFLEKQKENIHINLYVPETISSCFRSGFKKCDNTISKFKSIAGLDKDSNKYTGLYIYQHKEGKDCVFPEGYKCTGCTESGQEREQKEGKKYSNNNYTRSEINGIDQLLKCDKKYIIHNSGGKPNNKSIIITLTNAEEELKSCKYNEAICFNINPENKINTENKILKSAVNTLFTRPKIEDIFSISLNSIEVPTIKLLNQHL